MEQYIATNNQQSTILYIRVNYNDLTVLQNPGIMVYFRETIPKWPNYSD